jgi:hypothetical protein
MPTPLEKATAYLSNLEADRMAATAVSKEKAQEAIEVRKGEAMEIFGLNVAPRQRV